MSVQLQPNITQNAQDLMICQEYWSFDHTSNYVGHLEAICHKYDISLHHLCDTISQCFAYLDDVRCVQCGYVCPLEIPADIPFMRAKEGWCCEVCEHALWREHNNSR